jgi:hypothetical protein
MISRTEYSMMYVFCGNHRNPPCLIEMKVFGLGVGGIRGSDEGCDYEWPD